MQELLGILDLGLHYLHINITWIETFNFSSDIILKKIGFLFNKSTYSDLIPSKLTESYSRRIYIIVIRKTIVKEPTIQTNLTSMTNLM